RSPSPRWKRRLRMLAAARPQSLPCAPSHARPRLARRPARNRPPSTAQQAWPPPTEVFQPSRLVRCCITRWLAVVLAAIAFLWAAPARAQSIPSPPSSKPTAADEATAKKNFDSGLKLYGEGSFAEALIAFEQSYRRGGRPSALKNIAQCHRNLKHFVDAYDAYEQMLALHEAQLPAADKAAVRQALDELGVLTGTLEVVVRESGADIEIDGKGVGPSPMAKPKRVKVDPHKVRVSKAGFQPFEETVMIGSQE